MQGHLDDDEDCDLLLSSESLDWLYFPYDGGADAVLSNGSSLDELYAKFSAWAAPWNDWHPIEEWRGPDLRR